MDLRNRLRTLAACLLLAGCNPFAPTYAYRYRLTVEVDTPDGLRTASSVWETSAREGSGIPDSGIRSSFRGEAVPVVLPRGTLFALLRGQDMSADYPVGVVDGQYDQDHTSSANHGEDWKALRQKVVRSRSQLTLQRRSYPLLVRFRDINDPASVEIVDPANLVEAFGPGVRLRRITVAVTDDEVTEGIEAKLPWMKKVGRERGALIPNTPSLLKDASPRQLITPNDLSTEL